MRMDAVSYVTSGTFWPYRRDIMTFLLCFMRFRQRTDINHLSGSGHCPG